MQYPLMEAAERSGTGGGERRSGARDWGKWVERCKLVVTSGQHAVVAAGCGRGFVADCYPEAIRTVDWRGELIVSVE